MRREYGLALPVRERIRFTREGVESIRVKDERDGTLADQRPDEGPRLGIRRQPGTERERVGIPHRHMHRLEGGRRDRPLLGLLQRTEDGLRELRLNDRE